MFSILTVAINKALNLDPQARTRLAELNGRSIKLDITSPFSLQLYVVIDDDQLTLLKQYDNEVSCAISGSANSLWELVRSDEPTRVLSNGEVQVEGDIRIAQQLGDNLKQLDIDWEDILSKFTGDFVAHRAGNTARSLKDDMKQRSSHNKQDLINWLTAHDGPLVSHYEIEDHYQQLETFRDDVERLSARVNQLVNHNVT